jgi:hypothetical protein
MASRENETRAAKQRTQSWKPASLLPTPDPIPGVSYRWVRTGSRGNPDTKNVSSRFREGWVPVSAKDHPELQVMSDQDSRFSDGVEIGGLLLCQNDAETTKQRAGYFANLTQTQMQSVDNNLMRESDPRMPLSRPERRTRTTFGSDE